MMSLHAACAGAAGSRPLPQRLRLTYRNTVRRCRDLHPRVLTCAGTAAAICLLALFGWAADVTWAKQLAPGCPPMVPTTALCALALAATWLLPRGRAVSVAAATAVCGAVELSRYVVHLDVGRGGVLTGTALHGYAGRMSVIGAAAVVLLAVARSAAATGPDGARWGNRRCHVVQGAGLLTLVLIVPALIGYALQRPRLSGLGSSLPLSLPSAFALGALALGVLLDVRRGVLPWMLDGRDVGAALLRRIVPVTFVALPVIAYLRILGQRADWYGTDVGVTIMTLSTLVTIGITAYLAATGLVRGDRIRAEAVDTLRTITVDVDALVHARADELAASRHVHELARDRERISADLHDVVIQRLYAITLTLDTGSSDPAAVSTAVDGIDAAIADLRRTIHNLRASAADVSIEQTIIDLRWLCEATDFDFTVEVEGLLDTLPTAVRVHLAAVVRESVTNAVRHSGGSAITLRILRSATDVTMLCADDGDGVCESAGTPSGLRNIRTRATDLGGQATWASNTPRGAVVTWHVPLAAAVPSALTARPSPMADSAGDVVAALSASDGQATAGRLAAVARVLRDQLDAEGLCVVFCTPEAPDQLFVAHGEGVPAELIGMRYHRDASLVAPAFESGRCLAVSHLTTASAAGRRVAALQDGPGLIAPVAVPVGDTTLDAAIVLLRGAHRAPFSTTDVDRAEVATRIVATSLAAEAEAPAALSLDH